MQGAQKIVVPVRRLPQFKQFSNLAIMLPFPVSPSSNSKIYTGKRQLKPRKQAYSLACAAGCPGRNAVGALWLPIGSSCLSKAPLM
jgi:hypothetical protein